VVHGHILGWLERPLPERSSSRRDGSQDRRAPAGRSRGFV